MSIDAAAPPSSRPRGRRWLIALAILVGLVLLFGAVGAWLAPSIAKSQIEKRASEVLGRTVKVGAVSIKPYTLVVELTDLVIEGRGGEKPLFAAKSVLVDAEWASIIQRGAVLAKFVLTNPQSYLEQRADGAWNFDDITAKLAAQPKSEGPPARFSVSNIELLGGQIEIRDAAADTTHKIDALEIGLPFISNLPYAVETTVEPRIKARINDDPLVLAAHSTPFKDSLGTALEINLDDFDLPHYVKYIRRLVPITIQSGKLKTALTVQFERTREAPALVTVTGTLGLKEFSAQDANGKPLAALRGVDAKLTRFTFPSLATELEEVTVDGLALDVVRDKSGAINLLSVLAPAKPVTASAPKPATEAKPFPLTIKRLVVADSTVRWRDEALPRPFAAVLTPLKLEIDDLALASGAPATVRLASDTDNGSRVETEAKVTLTPLALDGEVKFTGVRPQVAAAYFDSYFNVDILAQSSDLTTRYRVRQNGAALDWSLADARFKTLDLRLRNRADKVNWAVIPESAGVVSLVDGTKQQVVVESMTGRGGRILVERARDGTINWTKFVVDDAKRPAAPPTPVATAGKPWGWSVKSLRLTDHAITWKDATTSEPIETKVTRINLAVDGGSDNLAAPVRIAIDSVVNQTGKLAMKGSFAPLPLAGKLEVSGSGLEVVPFQPYFGDRLNISVTRGALAARGTIDLATPKEGPPTIAYRGDLGAADFVVLDKLNATDFARARAFDMKGVELVSSPFSLAIADTSLAGFYTRLIMSADGKFNASNVVVASKDESAEKQPAEKPPAEKPAASAVGSTIKLGRIRMSEGNLVFTDQSVKPAFTSNLTELAGGVSELTPERPGDVELRGRIDGAGSIALTGQLNALAPQLFLDLKLNVKDVELPPTSPYAIKYAGYDVERGKLSLDLAYKINERKLDADNHLRLDQFRFGEKVESPTATKMPVTLAVALLRDRNGVIDLKLPVGGSLDDPKFSIGGIVVQVILNVLTKAITSPFALLGSLFGGGGDELAFAEFAAGASALDATATGRLKSLAKGLVERPALRVDIVGRVDPETDRAGLARAALLQRFKKSRFDELARTRTPAVSIDAVSLTEEELTQRVEAAYRAAPPKPVAGAKPPPKPSREEMERHLATAIDIGEDDLRALADRRAATARDAFVAEGVPTDRLFVIAPKLVAEEVKDGGKLSRVDFALK